ncbi:MAG: nucleotidyltransferase [Akkermansia sp.]|nr:nucleotidyltransferase [Akkermansia sp.]
MRNDIIEQVLKDIDLPDTVIQRAEDRYVDLGKWLSREESAIAMYHPYVFPQGSFLLQTAIRPLSNKDEYDLDIGCCFLKGLTTKNISQESLKKLLKIELESYRKARNIKAALDEKKRCWRLEYQDNMSFHIDIVPCLPVNEKAWQLYGDFFVRNVSKQGELLLTDDNKKDWSLLSLFITDNQNIDYKAISDNWHHSNPKGFSKWFQARAALAQLNEMILAAAPRNEVEDLPSTTNKPDTVLQQVVKLLKRHRDVMFEEDKTYAPISVIISKLAAEAYSGEKDLGAAIMNVLEGMKNTIQFVTTFINNPTEPLENFADKWVEDSNYGHQFRMWIAQATRDFGILTKASPTQEEVQKILASNFSLSFGETYKKLVQEKSQGSLSYNTPFNIASTTTKPWLQ